MEGMEPLGKLSELEGKIKVSDDTIQIGKIKFYANRVTFDPKATLEDGRIAGIYVQREHRSNLWALGDWALGMETKFNEEAAQYVSTEHFTEAYLRRSRWVCEKIAPSRRLLSLSFEHHAAVAGLESADQDKWLRRAIDKKLSVQDLRRAIRQKSHKDRYVEQDLPEGRYRVLYIDPPWKFDDNGVIPGGDHGTEAYGKAERHYPPMEDDQILELPIKEITARNAVLALWVPVPRIPTGCEVMAAWGFIYKTEYVWHKVGESGLGQNTASHYSKLEHEVLLIGTHGKMTPDMEVAMKFPSVQEYPRPGEHSQKPEEFRTMLDTLYPSVTKTKNDRVELFARYNAEGWDQWGNEKLQADGKAAAAGDDVEDAGGDNPVDADAEQRSRGGKKNLRAVS